jgi:hypothetical protein
MADGIGRVGPRLPTGLAGAFVLAALVELAVASGDLMYATDAAVSWRESARRASRRTEDVLCLGDSLVKFGVLPRGVEAVSGLRAYNLAVYSGPPAASYFLLRRATEGGSRPRFVVVDFLPEALRGDPRDGRFRRAWPELLTARDCLDLGRTTGDVSFAGELLLARALPSFRARREVGRLISASLRQETASPRHALRALRKNWDANLGAQVSSRSPAERDGAAGPPATRPPSGRWRGGAVNTAYVGRFLELAERHGIRVAWLLPPLPAAHGQLDPAYEGFVRSLQRRYAGLTVLDARCAAYPRSFFLDDVHLNLYGALALSADVTAALVEPPAPGRRWHVLPPGRKIALAIPVDDLEHVRRPDPGRGRR